MELEQRINKHIPIICMLLGGYTTKEIAGARQVSARTIEEYIRQLYDYFEVHKMEHLIGRLIKGGIIGANDIIFKPGTVPNSCQPCRETGKVRTTDKTIFI